MNDATNEQIQHDMASKRELNEFENTEEMSMKGKRKRVREERGEGASNN